MGFVCLRWVGKQRCQCRTKHGRRKLWARVGWRRGVTRRQRVGWRCQNWTIDVWRRSPISLKIIVAIVLHVGPSAGSTTPATVALTLVALPIAPATLRTRIKMLVLVWVWVGRICRGAWILGSIEDGGGRRLRLGNTGFFHL